MMTPFRFSTNIETLPHQPQLHGPSQEIGRETLETPNSNRSWRRPCQFRCDHVSKSVVVSLGHTSYAIPLICSNLTNMTFLAFLGPVGLVAAFPVVSAGFPSDQNYPNFALG
jgi:hypothetical protein